MADYIRSPFDRSVSVSPIRLRWLNCQCFEIKLDTGKTIVLDPFLPGEGNEKFAKFASPYTVDSLEACDYVIINHTHGDHVGSLSELWERFSPTIICHYSVAMTLLETHDVPAGKIVPVGNGETLYFDDFRLETFIGQHVAAPRPARPSLAKMPPSDSEAEKKLNTLGTMFNTNYIITTKSQFRIGFAPGLRECIFNYHWNEKDVDLLLRQYYPGDRPIPRIAATLEEDFANELAFVGAPLNMPCHQEATYEPGNPYDDMNEFTRTVNRILAERGSVSRMLNPERGRWYTVSMGITAD